MFYYYDMDVLYLNKTLLEIKKLKYVAQLKLSNRAKTKRNFIIYYEKKNYNDYLRFKVIDLSISHNCCDKYFAYFRKLFET